MFSKSGILEMQNADMLHELIESKPISKKNIPLRKFTKNQFL